MFHEPVSATAIESGFRFGGGTHTSRTIMLAELRAVLAHCGPHATRDEYLSAIHEDNCLGKRTAATRKLSSQRLSELYAIDPDVPLFRVMRRCWYVDAKTGKRCWRCSWRSRATRCSERPLCRCCGCGLARSLRVSG